MPEDNAQASVTADNQQTPPPPATEPEAQGEMPGAQQRIRDLVAERKAVEAKLDEERQGRQRLEADFRSLREQVTAATSAATEPDTPEWEDPAEVALREAKAAKAEIAKVSDNLNRSTAMGAIKAAVDERDFEDADDVRERLAERYYLAQQRGLAFDATAEAKALHDRETKRITARKEAWAQTKADDAAATASAVSGSPAPPPEPDRFAPENRPAWGSPERATWDADIEREVLAGNLR